MGKLCVVPGCINSKGHKGFVCNFYFPKREDLLQKWLEAIPCIKRPVKSCWRVCQDHFEPEEIVKYFSHQINGKVYLLKRGRAKLKVNAVPTRNLQLCKDITLKPANAHKRKIKPTPQQPTAGIVENKRNPNTSTAKDCHANNTPQKEHEVPLPLQQEYTSEASELTEIEQEIEISDISNAITKLSNEGIEIRQIQIINNENIKTVDAPSTNENETEEELLRNLFDNVFEVVLPSTLWGVHRSTNQNRIMFVCIDEDQLNISKMLIVDNTGNLKIYSKTKLIRQEQFLLRNMLTTEYITDTLAELDAM